MLDWFDLMRDDANAHNLLYPARRPYSKLALNRAHIVWEIRGRRDNFWLVCDYFIRLEEMEEKLTTIERTESRQIEYKLLRENPPVSQFQMDYFPNLYKNISVEQVTKQMHELLLEKSIFKLEGYNLLEVHKAVTNAEKVEANDLIKAYSKSNNKSLMKVLMEFNLFAERTVSRKSMINMAVYIKKQNIKAELITHSNFPKKFSFLEVKDAVEHVKKNASSLQEYEDAKAVESGEETHIKRGNIIKIFNRVQREGQYDGDIMEGITYCK